MRFTTFKPANRVRSLATVSSLALCAVMPLTAFAQDAAAPASDEEELNDEDVIVVSGYRAALQNAQSIKEDADTFVDVITADDIGALLDGA